MERTSCKNLSAHGRVNESTPDREDEIYICREDTGMTFSIVIAAITTSERRQTVLLNDWCSVVGYVGGRIEVPSSG